jgi:hypothetical protein
MSAGTIPRSLLVHASSASAHAVFQVVQKTAPQCKKTPRQVISDMKWEGETWISSEELAKKRQRQVETEERHAAPEGDKPARPPKPADVLEDGDDDTGRSKDKDVVPSRMQWVFNEEAWAWEQQERPRTAISGIFFGYAAVPSKQVELLNTILNQDACPVDEDFLRTEVVPRLNRTHKVSLRLLDWLVVDYAREKNVAYRQYVPVLNREVIVVVHQLYCSLRDRWRRRRFDCFRRRHRIYFTLDGSTYSTTVAQLHFFYIAKMYGFLDYAAANLDSIEAHMKHTLDETAKAKQRAKASNKFYRRKPLVKKATSRVFVSDVPYKLSFEYDTIIS